MLEKSVVCSKQVLVQSQWSGMETATSTQARSSCIFCSLLCYDSDDLVSASDLCKASATKGENLLSVRVKFKFPTGTLF